MNNEILTLKHGNQSKLSEIARLKEKINGKLKEVIGLKDKVSILNKNRDHFNSRNSMSARSLSKNYQDSSSLSKNDTIKSVSLELIKNPRSESQKSL